MPRSVFILMALFGLSSCDPDEGADSKDGSAAADAARMLDFKQRQRDGAKHFALHCVSCHGEDGAGGGQYPPLQGSEIIAGDPQRLVLLIQKGVRGPKIVDGVDYGTVEMPSWEDQLDAADTAAVITYIRSAWGNRPDSGDRLELVPVEQVEQWIEQLEGVEGPLPFEQMHDGSWKEYFQ